jgi:hypothetical protein
VFGGGNKKILREVEAPRSFYKLNVPT